MESIPVDILNLIYVLIAVVVGYMIFHKLSDVVKVKIKSTKTNEKRNYDNSSDIDTQLNNFIKGAPDILTKLTTEIDNLKEKGANEEQLKSLKNKQSTLQFIVQNKEIIEIIGTPIIKKLVGFIKAI